MQNADKACLRGERRTKAGEILLSHNHIALLHGLYDRPHGTASSCSDLVRAAMPYLSQIKSRPSWWCLRRSIRSLHPSWATRARKGRRIEVTITSQGRAIVDRTVPVRICGCGLYTGFAAMRETLEARTRGELPPAAVREIIAYTQAFGVPLLPAYQGDSHPTLYAVSTGLDKPFRLVSREEFEQRGPRRWHYLWTHERINLGAVPLGYRSAFQGYDADDVRCYLLEARRANAEEDVYALAYTGEKFLSAAKLKLYMEEEIDLAATDIPSDELTPVIRGLGWTHDHAVAALRGAPRLTWRHPDKGGRSIGSVYDQREGPYDQRGLIATSPAALSCFAFYCQVTKAHVYIQTKYIA